jgi:hypothetical protein
MDFTRKVRRARQKAGVVAPGRFGAGSDVGCARKEPDLSSCADGDGARLDGHAHGALEVVVRQGQLALPLADGDHFPSLVG